MEENQTTEQEQEITSSLTEKLGKTSLSEQTIGAYVKENLPADGQEFDYDKAHRFLTSLGGQLSRDVAKTVNEQVEDFKKNYKPEDKKEPKKKKGEGEETESEIAELRKKLEEFEAKSAEKESSEKQKEILAKVKAELKKKGATDDYVLRKTLQGVKFDTKKDIEETVKEMQRRYDKEYTECRGKGASPRGGSKGTGGSKGKTVADEYWARKAAKKGFGKK